MLGSLVWAERQRRGWSQAELALRAGCSQSQIWQLEGGRLLWADPALIARLAAALDLPVEMLARAAGPSPRRARRGGAEDDDVRG
jgi:transcriptional regulator with XRE-family HTH domain